MVPNRLHTEKLGFSHIKFCNFTRASDGARNEDRGSDVSMGISALRSERPRPLTPMLVLGLAEYRAAAVWR